MSAASLDCMTAFECHCCVLRQRGVQRGAYTDGGYRGCNNAHCWLSLLKNGLRNFPTIEQKDKKFHVVLDFHHGLRYSENKSGKERFVG